MNPLRLQRIRSYLYGYRSEVMSPNIRKYDSQIYQKIDDVCIKMGYDCENDTIRFDRLREQLIKNIQEITTNSYEQDEIVNYVNCLIDKTRNYKIYLETKNHN